MGALCCKPQNEDLLDNQLDLSHFQLLKIIGKGSFGKVRIVQHKKSKKQYALKYIDKGICIKQKATANVILERTLLERVEYPFITNLRYAFQDDETLFMVLDLMLGGDLRFYMNHYQQQIKNELQVKHYVASIALSLGYLHKKRIAHRDIKPENILLDKKGYAHLTDFNIAIQFTSNQPLMWSVAGTMAYMSPEMLSRKGYFTSVDWWSLGVVAYELLFGMRPYQAQSKDALAYSICNDPLKFPDNAYGLVSKNCIDVISGLLDKSPFNRLGCSTDGFEKFKMHPWFKGFDWDLLEKKQLAPPCIRPDKNNIKKQHSNNNLFEEDGLKSHKRKSLPPITTAAGAVKSTNNNKRYSSSSNRSSSSGYEVPVTEEARYRLQLEEDFLDFDFSKHQMEEDEDHHSSFLEARRNSLKRQYERFKRRSQSSYQELPASPPYSD